MAATVFVEWPIPERCFWCARPFEDGKTVALVASLPPRLFHTGAGTNCLAPYAGAGNSITTNAPPRPREGG